ncbi:MAG: ShlB/FhaC/HecB family hemolysin secretion/activation protein [Parachlamydiales bacterium]|nr:ShlB/FhaC/HecB family hemolysin secretion/activation protein [Parachlamydiales bacterium]
MKKILFFFLFFSFVYADEQCVKIKDQDHVLVESLNKVVFQCEYHQIDDSTLKESLTIENVQIPDVLEFKKDFAKFLKQPLSLKKINEIKFFIINYFRKKDFPLVGVKVPAGQDVSKGLLYIIIHVAKLGEIDVKGAEYFSNNFIKKQFNLKKGDLISTKKLMQDLEWLNDNPFRNVNIIYAPGNDLSETDIILNVEDQIPFRAFVGYENTPYVNAGKSRFMAGFNLGNVFNLDQQLNIQFLSAKSAKKWWGITGNYIIPLPWRNILKFLGSYSRASSDINTFQESKGKGLFLGGRYEIPLPIWYNVSHDILIGYDFKRTNNFLAFADNLIFNHYIDISQFFLRYQGTKEDSKGVISYEVTLFISPGNMTKYDKNSYYDIERSGAKANYAFIQLDLERIFKLPYRFSWVINFLGQLASGKLLLSEQLALGGATTVRGYLENEAMGDNGFLLKNELRLPFYHFGKDHLVNTIQFLGFIDLGVVTDSDKSVSTKKGSSLLSIGPGMRYNISTNLTTRLDYGWQLKSVKGRILDSSRSSRWHLSVIASY